MILSQLHISFLSHAGAPEAVQPCTATLPPHLTPRRANILGASAAGFAAPYQLFNFPGSTASSFSGAAACQPAAILWSGVDILCYSRIKPCMLSEKVLFLVLLFVFFLSYAIPTDCLHLLEVRKTIFFLSRVGGMAECKGAARALQMGSRLVTAVQQGT